MDNINLSQINILKRILNQHDKKEMDMETFGTMLQEIGIFLMWNSPNSNYGKCQWKKLITKHIKPFINYKKISGGEYARCKNY